MIIKKYTFELHNDFSAILVCEDCESEQELTTGYKDAYYYTRVLPNILCKKCGKSSTDLAKPISREAYNVKISSEDCYSDECTLITTDHLHE